MSCRNIETIIPELARGQMLEARAKEDALAHMEACERCAARFADEQTLTSGLRAVVAVSAASAATPAHVEAALLAAFRQRAASPFATPRQSNAAMWKRWSIAAAAVILVVAAFASLRLLSTNSSGELKQGASVAQPAQLSSPGQPVDERGVKNAAIMPTLEADKHEQQLVSIPQFSRKPTDRARGLVHDAGLNNRQTRNPSNSETVAKSSEEITTDFLPLSYGSSMSQFDDGQIVRVELPRSALQSFGLPVNAERASERVKADVLLGHDGVAQAIRFVR
jgi:hypothetical protein